MIRDLNSQGLNVSEISRQTGYDRKTVKKYLDLKTVPQAQERQRKASKLDPYKPYILEKLSSDPYTAARLYREIKDKIQRWLYNCQGLCERSQAQTGSICGTAL